MMALPLNSPHSLQAAPPQEDIAARVSLETLNSVGLPVLPNRFAPLGKRRLFSLAMARRELASHLPGALMQAVDRIKALIAEAAPQNYIDDARQELAFLRHSRGPLFQLGILTQTGAGKLQPLIMPNQTSLERVREIGAAIAIAVNQIPLRDIQRAIRSLHRPWFPDSVATTHRALADAFMAGSAADNIADPRFARLQRLVDEAGQAARATTGGNPKRIAAAITSARDAIAARIRDGEIDTITEL